MNYSRPIDNGRMLHDHAYNTAPKIREEKINSIKKHMNEMTTN